MKMEEENAKFTWNKYFRGKLSKKAHFRVMAGAYIVLLGTFGISAFLYEKTFTFRNACVSNVGNPIYNPRGWWIFTLVYIFSGIFFVGHHLYIYKRLDIDSLFLKNSWLFLSIIGDIGIVFTGIFNETLGFSHILFAVMAFGGLGLAIIEVVLLISYWIIAKKKYPSPRASVLLLCFFTLMTAIIVRELVTYGIKVPYELNFAEWIAFFLVLGWQLLLLLVISPKFPKNNENDGL